MTGETTAMIPGLRPTPPPKFLELSGEPPIPFKLWIGLVNDYFYLMECVTGHSMPDRQKNIILISFLGSEATRQASAHPVIVNRDSVTYADIISALTVLFSHTVPPIRACFDFLNRKQAPSENANEFLLSLRSMLPDCNFPSSEENRMLAIAFTIGCRQKHTQEKLLAQSKIDLDEFMRIANADESARENVAAIRGEYPTAHKVQSKHSLSVNNRPQHQSQQIATSSKSANSCSGCGSKTHAYKDNSCPARNSVCHFCQSKGHFQKFCRKKRNRPIQVSARANTVRINGLAFEANTSCFNCQVEIRSSSGFVPVEAEVDSGSDVTTITQSTYNAHFSDTPLSPAPTRISNFDGSPIQYVSGQFESEIRYRDRTCSLAILVVSDVCSSVLGKNAIQSLALTLDGYSMKVRAVHSSYKLILSKYPNVTAPGIGTFPDFQHVITLTDNAKPRVVKLRPVPLARRDAVAKEINYMVEQGIWEKADKSSWVHQMVTVMKPNGQPRITTDLSPLNLFVIPERYPLPNVKDLFLDLTGSTIFSKLDLKKGYFHIELSPESRALTATITPSGLYQYTKLPMGLKDSASVFQKMVSNTLANCEGCICYIDDILIHASTVEEHDRRLECVLKRLSEKNFRLNVDKCVFGVSTVQFLGHEISSEGIHPHPHNMKAITEAGKPQNAKDVKRFLGMITYYQDFLPNLATITEPLRRLLRKNCKFHWRKEQETAFQKLKEMAGKKLSVYIFDPNLPTFVTVDASDVGLGAVLSQVKDGSEVPVCFASHSLTTAQRNYATNEKEALACLWACEKWEKFLLGRHFTLRTDHRPLTFLLKKHWQGRQSAKFVRWNDRLAQFDFDIQYRPGAENDVADFLSRHPVSSEETFEDQQDQNLLIRRVAEDGISVDIIREATDSDSLLQQAIHFVQTQWPKHMKHKDMKPFFNVRHLLSVEHGCLLREERLVLPGSLSKRLLRLAHAGHPGIVRMKRKLRETYWWPSMNNDIDHFVKHCQACQCSEKSFKPNVVPRMEIPVPDTAWSKVAIDIAGPYYTAPIGRRFIVTIIDYYSKFPEVLLTDTTTSLSIIKWLEEIFARYGNPDELISDNGPQFVSHEFQYFLKSRNIRHHRTSVYTPQQNGLVEVFNRLLKHGIQAFCSAHTSWDQGIIELLSHYRATAPSPDQMSPCELMFGRKMRLPFEVSLTNPDTTNPPLVTTNSASTSAATGRGPYKRGEWVCVRRHHTLKGQSPFSRPMKVTEVLGNWTYRLSDNQVWNARRMRRHFSPYNDDLDFTVASPDIPGVRRRCSKRSTKGKPPQRFSP